MMPNETIMQTSCIQDNPEADECNENIPTADGTAAGTSKFKLQAEDVRGQSPIHGPLLETCDFSTPNPTNGNNGGKRKLGFQSTLTPILNYLNIDAQRSFTEPLMCGFPKKNCQKSTGGTGQKPNTSNPYGRSFGSIRSPMCLLDFEQLPEITLLDSMCDSTMQLTTNVSVLPEGAPATPTVCDAITCVEQSNGPSELPKPVEITAGTRAEVKADDPNENKTASSRILDQYLTEITLLDNTCDSLLSPCGQVSTMNTTQEMVQALSKLCGQTVAEPVRSEAVSNEEMSSTSGQSISIIKTSVEVTQDITMGSVLEHSGSSSKTSQENVENSQISRGDTFDKLPADMTCNITSSSASGMDCSSGPKGVFLELRSEPTNTPDNMDGPNEEILTAEVSQQSSKTVVSENNTVSVLQASSRRSFDINTSAPVFCSEDNKPGLPTSDANGLVLGSQGATDQAEPLSCERAFAVTQSCSFSKENGECEVPNATFDKYSSQNSRSSTTIEGGVPPTVHVQNNTFDFKTSNTQNATVTLSESSSCDNHHSSLGKPPTPTVSNTRNATVTLSESSSCDNHHSSLGKPPTPKVCNLTTSIKDDNSDDQLPELPKETETTAVTAGPRVETVENPNGTFEATPVLEAVSGDGTCEHKDQLQSELSCVSDTSTHQTLGGKHKANTFDLDESLDLRVDAWVTSTPLINCKISNPNLGEPSKVFAGPKKLYGDGPSQPSNIVGDQKTFLTQRATKAFWPVSNVALRPSENKAGSKRPGRPEPVTSGLPVKGQRTHADALRNAAAEETRKTTRILSSYNLRSAAASKIPSSGLQRPQVSGIPSSIQRAAPGLTSPTARVPTQASANADRPCRPGPAASNLVTKNLQGKKHPLTKGHVLPVPKRKKTDILVPSNNTEPASSSCDSTNKVKNLKQPTAGQRSLPPKAQKIVPASTAETVAACDVNSKTKSLKQPATTHRSLLTKPQTQGCAKCTALEKQLQVKSEEIQKLKEELLKYRK